MTYETKIIDFSASEDNTFHYDPYHRLQNCKPEDLVANVRELVYALIPFAKDLREPFWIQGAQNILTACILYAFGYDITFNETMEMILTTPSDTLRDAIAGSDNDAAKSFIIQYPSGNSHRSDDKALWGSFIELTNHIRDLAHVQVKNVFEISEKMVDWEEDLSSYNIVIRVEESKLPLLCGALRLMSTQLLSVLADRPDKYSPEGRTQVPLLLLWDELPRIGKMENIAHGLTTLRSRGVTNLMAVQSLAQLDSVYGPDERRVIVDSCSYIVIAAVHDAETQQYCSDLVGSTQSWTPSISENYHPSREEFGFSRQINQGREPRIYPEEFATLRDFVLITPHGAFRIEKSPHYQVGRLLRNNRSSDFSDRAPIMLNRGRDYHELQRDYGCGYR